jgi:hypothetical protein
MLEPQQETFYLYTDGEIQEIIQGHFKRPDYRLMAVEEKWHTDCDYQFQGARKGANTSTDRDAVEEFRANGAPAPFMTLLCALIDEEVLPEGNYLISVS